MQKLHALINITPLAQEKLKEILSKEDALNSYLRIEVYQSGGCACSGGYRYALSLEKEPRENDLVEEINGLRIVVDKANADFIRGSKIDYHESLQRSGFKIDNPNVHAQGCGCGGH